MTKFISEECYNDIMEMAAQMVASSLLSKLNEDIFTKIEKEHGKPEYDQAGKPLNKSAELTNKAKDIQDKDAKNFQYELNHSNGGGKDISDYLPKNVSKHYYQEMPGVRMSKTEAGKMETDSHRKNTQLKK
jgi:hypothetical protein